jgi:transposase
MKSITIPPIVEREQLLQTSVEALVEIILRQQESIQQLVEEVERLKTNANSDSRSSSKPPSSDLHKRSEKSAPEEPSTEKRRPGGQPGHIGTTRKGFGRVDRYEVVRPQICSECGGRAFEDTPESVQYREIAELVEPAIEVVAYEQQCCTCLDCGALVWGVLPASVIGAQSLGARLQALLVWLGNYGHLSYEKQQELLQELGQIVVGTGTLQTTNARMSETVTGAVERLGDWVKQSAHVQVDETPWLVKGVKEWMWVVCGVGFCLFHAGDTRSRAELETLLGQSFVGCSVLMISVFTTAMRSERSKNVWRICAAISRK